MSLRAPKARPRSPTSSSRTAHHPVRGGPLVSLWSLGQRQTCTKTSPASAGPPSRLSGDRVLWRSRARSKRSVTPHRLLGARLSAKRSSLAAAVADDGLLQKDAFPLAMLVEQAQQRQQLGTRLVETLSIPGGLCQVVHDR